MSYIQTYKYWNPKPLYTTMNYYGFKDKGYEGKKDVPHI
jgi:hypothetical protein